MGHTFVIEGGDVGRPRFLGIDPQDVAVIWTDKTDNALQMARKSDADNVAKLFMRGCMSLRVHELTT